MFNSQWRCTCQAVNGDKLISLFDWRRLCSTMHLTGMQAGLLSVSRTTNWSFISTGPACSAGVPTQPLPGFADFGQLLAQHSLICACACACVCLAAACCSNVVPVPGPRQQDERKACEAWFLQLDNGHQASSGTTTGVKPRACRSSGHLAAAWLQPVQPWQLSWVRPQPSSWSMTSSPSPAS